MKLILVGLAFMVAVVVKVNSEWQLPSEAEYEAFELECHDPNPNSPQRSECETKCVLEKAGIFDETRGFDEENLIKSMVLIGGFGENIAREKIGRCDLKKGDSGTVCDWAARGIRCVYQERKPVEISS